MTARPACPTSCRICRWHEMTPWERLRDRVRTAVVGVSVREVGEVQAHAVQAMMRAYGGLAPVTDYDRHRERFETTGDPVELERMLRHVQPEMQQ